MELEEIYKEVILEHYQNPRNYGEIPYAHSSEGINPLCKVDGENPICGDAIYIQFLVEDDKLEDIKFTGVGCAISQASASIMTELVKGKSIEDIRSLIIRFKRIMEGKEDFTEDLGDLLAFEGIRRLPVRIKCVLLAWEVLLEGINKISKRAGG
ncbi:MAG: SUF system NifU family Fe-S cluster assembly protein [bacterium]|nr:SUF system NifU family Fe-S cluster assembly protein [bacterium]